MESTDSLKMSLEFKSNRSVGILAAGEIQEFETQRSFGYWEVSRIQARREFDEINIQFTIYL